MGNLNQTQQSTHSPADPSEKMFSLEDMLAVMGPEQIEERFDWLTAGGIHPSQLLEQAWPSTIVEHLEEFLEDGVDVNQIVQHLNAVYLAGCAETLLRCGCDATYLAERLSKPGCTRHAKLLRQFGADSELLKKKVYLDLNHEQVRRLCRYNGFYPGGYPMRVTAEMLLRGAMSREAAVKNLELLKRVGIEVDDIVNYVAGDRDLLAMHLSELLARGADPTNLAKRLSPRDQLEYYSKLMACGVEFDEEKLLRYVRKHGNPESIAIVAILVMDHGGDPSGLESLYEDHLATWIIGASAE